MDKKERKVIDLTLRREAQLQNDPVLALADVLTRVVANHATRSRPEEQLLALELTVRAVVEALKHAHGDIGLNEIIVEVERRRHMYTIGWPEHDQSPTVYDEKEEPAAKPVRVIRGSEEKKDEGFGGEPDPSRPGGRDP